MNNFLICALAGLVLGICGATSAQAASFSIRSGTTARAARAAST